MINLLPSQEKQILLKEKQFKEFLILSFLMLICFFVFCSILFFIQVNIKDKALLQKQILFQEETTKIFLDIESLENEIKEFNKIISEVNNFLKGRYYLADIFIELSYLKPQGLYFTNISYNQKKQEFSMAGFSQKREQLLIFKENLERQASFKDIYFPPSNWLKSENLDFFVKFRINNQ